MDILIERNFFKLLTRKWLVIQPERLGRYFANNKYKVITTRWGEMGIAELTHESIITTGDMRGTVMALCDGDDHFARHTVNQMHLVPSELIQVCTFHFVRRFNAPFEKMITQYSKEIGLDLFVKQPEIFENEHNTQA